MAEIDPIELDQYNTLVDNLVEDIEAGRVKSNPLAPEAVTVADVDASTTSVHETATELGEDSVKTDSKTPKISVTINGTEFSSEEGEIIGNAGKVLIVVSNVTGEIIFGSAAVAARETGFNPTTVRSRCSKEYVDADGNTWCYRDKIEEE